MIAGRTSTIGPKLAAEVDSGGLSRDNSTVCEWADGAAVSRSRKTGHVPKKITLAIEGYDQRMGARECRKKHAISKLTL